MGSRQSQGRPVHVLMLGVDGVGKTTLMRREPQNEMRTTVPTIGMHVEMKMDAEHSVMAWDVCGADKYECIVQLYRQFFVMCNALVFVVDGEPLFPIETIRCELQRIVAEDELAGWPVLILANKHDMPGALTVSQVEDALGIADSEAFAGRPYKIQPCVATDIQDKGYEEGLSWLREQLLARPRDLPSFDPAAFHGLYNKATPMEAWQFPSSP